MQNKTLGIIIMLLALVALGVFFYFQQRKTQPAITTTVKTAGGGLGLLQGLGNIFTGIAAVKSLKEDE